MDDVTPYHHGITVTDLTAWRAALATLGFTRIEPGAEEPRRYANVDGDPVGRMVAGWLGDSFATHWVENPDTGQQLDLIEVGVASRAPRPSAAPVQGDITVGIPERDPATAYAAMRVAAPELVFSAACPGENPGDLAFQMDGQAIILTPSDPFTRLHYSARDWPAARVFLEDVLGFACSDAGGDPAGRERYRLATRSGRVEVEVSVQTCPAPASSGKKYPGANHLRLLGADLDAIARRVATTGQGSWLFAPAPGGSFAQIYGPTAEFIELYC